MRALLAACLAASALIACNPRCERVCDKALACDLTPRLAHAECEEACTRQDVLYETWEDEVKQEAFAEHKRCVMGATCDEIADGECFDDELFIF